MTDLEFTRDLWRRTAFSWGSADCILSVCDHVERMTGIDPAAPWRGSYDSENGARRIWEKHGGKLNLFRHGMERAGFDATDPVAGWPVVANLFGHEMPGLFTGDRVLLRLENRGVIEARLPILGAWSQ